MDKICVRCRRYFNKSKLYCHICGSLLEDAPLPKGTVVIDGTYRIDAFVGGGGMGKIYKATHLYMNSVCAIKLMKEEVLANPVAKERFQREAQLAAKIDHENVVKVTHFGIAKDTGITFLVMEYLKGISLRQRLLVQKQLEYKEIDNILTQICSGVHATHREGIIHRDLKPDNIFILQGDKNNNKIKLLDFGIAKLTQNLNAPSQIRNDLTQVGEVIGTLPYMSPEQFDGPDIDFLSDIYSLGIILYQMLSGELPFNANNPYIFRDMHVNTPPESIKKRRADIPKPLEDVVMKALSKNKNDRQQSAIQLAEDFRMALLKPEITEYIVGPIPPMKPALSVESTSLVKPPSPINSIPPMNIIVSTPLEPTHKFDTTIKKPINEKSINAHKTDLIVNNCTNLTISSNIVPPTIVIPPDPVLPFPEPVPPPPDPLPIPEPKPPIYLLANNSRLIYFIIMVMILVGTSIVVIGWWSSLPTVKPSKTTPPQNTINTPPGMVLIPQGKFVMGNNNSSDAADRPEHIVEVQSFFIDKYEVTNEEYYQFILAAKYSAPANWINGKYASGLEKYPITNVSWYDAQAFAKWVNKRLPEEKEWEYAARGTDHRYYPWGNEFDAKKLNIGTNKKNSLVPVDRFSEGISIFGVFNMAGNAAEWTNTTFDPYPGSTIKPRTEKVVRGGSYEDKAIFSIVSSRGIAAPSTAIKNIGFRCAKDLEK